MLKVGMKALITTDNWFFAPNGQQYKAVFGTVKGVYDSQITLGVKTNAKSTNWYVVIGNMTLAGCQIHYAIETENVSFLAPTKEIDKDGNVVAVKQTLTHIYNADKKFKVKSKK